jgi:uracil-DNA glycosylase family 4
MNMDRQDRLKALGLWPVWRLRAAAMAEPEAASPDDAEPAVMAQITLPPAPAMPPSPVPSPLPDLDWDALGAAVKACDRCPLARSRTQGVPGVGDPNAEWLFIGEAPGADEDRQGEPFVGQAGKLLDAMMAGIGLRRGRNVYIANILKSRPPGNRDPRPEEVEACLPYLERQIDLIKPRLIVVLGRIAAQTLLVSDTPIGKLRGHVHQYRGVPMVVTYHPAYLLRNPADKAKAWEDLVLARQTMAGLKSGAAP